MKSPLFLLTALATAALLPACGRQARTDSANDAPAMRSESICFDAFEYQVSNELTGSADDYFRESDLVYTDSISLVFPVRIGDKGLDMLRDSIIRLAFDTIGCSIDSIISNYVCNDVRQFSYPTRRVAPVDIFGADGYELISGSVVNYNPSLLVYEVANSSYSPGAAHGITTRNYLNYDISAGRLINGSFMFAPGKRAELAQLIARRAAEMTQVIGPTQIESLPEHDNFYINPEGEIVFVYQPYEVASYAQGLISINFFPSELADYLTTEALKYFALNDLN